MRITASQLQSSFHFLSGGSTSSRGKTQTLSTQSTVETGHLAISVGGRERSSYLPLQLPPIEYGSPGALHVLPDYRRTGRGRNVLIYGYSIREAGWRSITRRHNNFFFMIARSSTSIETFRLDPVRYKELLVMGNDSSNEGDRASTSMRLVYSMSGVSLTHT